MSVTLTCPTPYKESFASKPDALHVIKRIETRAKRQKGNALAQEPYKCRCGAVHLAHPRRTGVHSRVGTSRTGLK